MRLEHTHGLAGHSDGDVLLHAITDALLGAVGAGDIGSFFPPSDAKWKGANSVVFLEEALRQIEMAGFRVVNIDTTMILAAPKIVPHAEKLRARVAELLNIPSSRVGIKAKTPEGTGERKRGDCARGGVAGIDSAGAAAGRRGGRRGVKEDDEINGVIDGNGNGRH